MVVEYLQRVGRIYKAYCKQEYDCLHSLVIRAKSCG